MLIELLDNKEDINLGKRIYGIWENGSFSQMYFSKDMTFKESLEKGYDTYICCGNKPTKQKGLERFEYIKYLNNFFLKVYYGNYNIYTKINDDTYIIKIVSFIDDLKVIVSKVVFTEN